MTTISPTRVVIEASPTQVGEAVSPRRARETPTPAVQFVFVRDDGWSLGACGEFALAAWLTWRHQYRVVFEVDYAGQVVEVMDPAAWKKRLGHYFDHAIVASKPIVSELGGQVLDRAPCPSCGWEPELEPSNVPEPLVNATTCQCVECRTADGWHLDVEVVHARLQAAVAKGDHAEAGRLDRIERTLLDKAGACLARCQGRASS